jgi:hypothetical protein
MLTPLAPLISNDVFENHLHHDGKVIRFSSVTCPLWQGIWPCASL